MNHSASPALKIFIIAVSLFAIGVGGYVLWQNSYQNNMAVNAPALSSQPATSSDQVAGVIYKNDTYGFTFALPDGWQDYTIVTSTREVRDVNSGNAIATAPTIKIRHPQWSKDAPREDIPVDIYALAQWTKIQNGDYSVGAAPIPPSEFGRNSQYVFALPARYNYDFLTGYEEVQSIIDSKPLTAHD